MDSEPMQTLTKVDTLSPTQRLFAMARARGQSVAEAAKAAGVHRGTPATAWDMDTINAAILEIQESMSASAIEAMKPYLPLALQGLESAIKKSNLDAIREVFNRIWGKPVQRQELAGAGGNAINVQVTYASELSDDDLIGVIQSGQT